MTLTYMFPRFSSYDESDIGFNYAVAISKFLLSMGRIICSYLANNIFGKFRQIRSFPERPSAARNHIRVIVGRGSFNDVARIDASPNVARMTSVWCSPVSVRKEERQPMWHRMFPLISTCTISSIFTDGER